MSVGALFWLSLGVIVYVYAGYPLLLWLVTRKRLAIAPPDYPESGWPRVALLIPAHNEETWIAAKLDSALALDYPPHKLRVVVVSDGSTDRTEVIARSYASRGVELAAFPRWQGKHEALNRVLPQLEEEIVVCTDAAAILDSIAVQRLVRHFADPTVGFVAGRRVPLAQENSASSAAESLYWRYEAWLRDRETRLHSTSGSDGQLFAARRAVLPRLESEAEDFLFPLAVVSRGLRAVFDPDARVFFAAAATIQAEFRRKIRSHVHVLNNIWLLCRLLVPGHSPVWWQLWSHHVLRMVVPPAMAATLIAGAVLGQSSDFYKFAFLAQLSFYAASAIGYALARRNYKPKLLYVPFYFTFTQIALMVAWWHWACGCQYLNWRPTERLRDAG